MSKNPLVEAQDIFFEKGGRPIFSSVSIQLNEGEVIIIKGKNGSGKTSLLKCLAGFYQINKGHILWGGQNILPSFATDETMLSWLGHLNALKLSLTVRENLQFYADLWDVSKEKFLNSVDYLNFSKYLDFPVSWLSAGEKKRLCIIRLIFSPSKVWLLDEPTTFLDKDNKRLFESLMENHVSAGGAIACATHDQLNIKKFTILNLDKF